MKRTITNLLSLGLGAAIMAATVAKPAQATTDLTSPSGDTRLITNPDDLSIRYEATGNGETVSGRVFLRSFSPSTGTKKYAGIELNRMDRGEGCLVRLELVPNDGLMIGTWHFDGAMEGRTCPLSGKSIKDVPLRTRSHFASREPAAPSNQSGTISSRRVTAYRSSDRDNAAFSIPASSSVEVLGEAPDGSTMVVKVRYLGQVGWVPSYNIRY